VVFREPILCRNVPRLIPTWTQPIIIGRHAFGDQYRATDFVVPGKGKLTIRWEGEDGKTIEHEVFDFPAGAWPWPCTTSTPQSRSSPEASLTYGLARKYPVYLSTKNTILKAYDGRFKDIAQRVFETEFARPTRRKASLTSTASSTTWWPRRSNGQAASCGRARTMTATSSPTRWLRASARWG